MHVEGGGGAPGPAQDLAPGRRRTRARPAGACALDLRQFEKKVKIFWKARNTREVSAGYMIRVTFAPAQKWRKTGALYVDGRAGGEKQRGLLSRLANLNLTERGPLPIFGAIVSGTMGYGGGIKPTFSAPPQQTPLGTCPF